MNRCDDCIHWGACYKRAEREARGDEAEDCDVFVEAK